MLRGVLRWVSGGLDAVVTSGVVAPTGAEKICSVETEEIQPIVGGYDHHVLWDDGDSCHVP